MPELKYEIGEMDLTIERLRFTLPPFAKDSYASPHKFIVLGSKGLATIYVSYGSHSNVAKRFSLERKKIVGGGSLYIDQEGFLNLNDFSGDFGTIPRLMRKELVDLLAPELRERGAEFKETSVEQVSKASDISERRNPEEDLDKFIAKNFGN